MASRTYVGELVLILAVSLVHCSPEGGSPVVPDAPLRRAPSAAVGESRRILFYSDRDGDFDIYRVNADGTDVVQLTDDPGADRGPRWSPDGSRIAFSSNRTGDFEIYVMNVDGSGVTQLTHRPTRNDWLPHWSPDGSRIAFSDQSRGNPWDQEVLVMNADGSGLTNLTNHPALDANPHWSPDGTRIAFAGNRDHPGGDVYLMNPDGSGVVRLTTNPANDSQADWSPDASRLVFISSRSGWFDLYVMNADGTDQLRITSTSTRDRLPDWSPDGEWIAFSGAIAGQEDIWLVRPDGTDMTRVTTSPGQDFAPDWEPVLSPTQIVENLDLAVLDLERLGVLGAGQANALASALDAALASLEQGNETAAVNQLRAFIQQVQALGRAGVLSPAEVQTLIDGARAAIDAILA